MRMSANACALCKCIMGHEVCLAACLSIKG